LSQVDYTKSLARVLVYEGGKVDDPRDPGGRTNQGVTQRTYNAWRRSKGLAQRDVYDMEDAERDEIYQGSYWVPARGDDLPVGLDLCVFDAAINSGIGRAGIWLQQALGAHYQGAIDGLVGDKTIQAVADYGDPDGLIQSFCSRRLATLKRLNTWATYGKGWSARIANVQKTACAWNDAAPEPDPVQLTDIGGHTKAVVGGNLKDPPLSQMTTHVAAGATTVGTVATQAAQSITPVQETFGWLKYVFGGLTLLAVLAGIIVKISADAKDAADKGTATAEVDLEADAGLPTVKLATPAATPAPAAPAAPAPAADPPKGS
jgi:lysozyme family protein